MKNCSKCKTEKKLVEFSKDLREKDKLNSRCKNCDKQYRLDKKKVINEKEKIWRENNKEKINIYNKEYYLKNKEKIIQYRIDNKEKIIQKNREYRIKNRNKIQVHDTKYKKNKILTDALFKLSCNTRHLIRKSIKRNGYSKQSKTYQILGCTFEEFKIHLENQFTNGMNWENQGKWHLDHIYPVSLAKDEQHLIKLNHYTNFQPLWAIDNISKSNNLYGKEKKFMGNPNR